MARKNQTYYYYGTKLWIVKKFVYGGEDKVVTINSDYEFYVHDLKDLKIWEETYQFKEQEKHKNALALIQTSKLKTIANIKSEAISELVSKLKINTIFGKFNKQLTDAGLQIARELESIINKKEIK